MLRQRAHACVAVIPWRMKQPQHLMYGTPLTASLRCLQAKSAT